MRKILRVSWLALAVAATGAAVQLSAQAAPSTAPQTPAQVNAVQPVPTKTVQVRSVRRTYRGYSYNGGPMGGRGSIYHRRVPSYLTGTTKSLGLEGN